MTIHLVPSVAIRSGTLFQSLNADDNIKSFAGKERVYLDGLWRAAAGLFCHGIPFRGALFNILFDILRKLAVCVYTLFTCKDVNAIDCIKKWKRLPRSIGCWSLYIGDQINQHEILQANLPLRINTITYLKVRQIHTATDSRAYLAFFFIICVFILCVYFPKSKLLKYSSAKTKVVSRKPSRCFQQLSENPDAYQLPFNVFNLALAPASVVWALLCSSSVQSCNLSRSWIFRITCFDIDSPWCDHSIVGTWRIGMI